MNDWGLSVLGQYPVSVRTARKVRGALLCDTDEGLYLLQEYRGTQGRLEQEAQLMQYLAENGRVLIDVIAHTTGNELLAKNEEGKSYVLKSWYPWQECNVNSLADLLQAINSLARLHMLMRRYKPESIEGVCHKYTEDAGVSELYGRHNRELRHVRSYLSKKRQKSEIEQLIQNSFTLMYEQAVRTQKQLEDCGFSKLEKVALQEGHIFHGAFHQHNVLIGQGKAAVVNFEQFGKGSQLPDVYQFMRKVLEKNNWNKELGKRLLQEYCRVADLSESEIKALGLMFAYPEKYWKQVNFYYNSNKSWISQKNIEKLKKAIGQYETRTAFAQAVQSM